MHRDDQLAIGNPAPNPVDNKIFFPVSTPTDIWLEYEIFSQTGQILQKGIIEIRRGSNQVEIGLDHGLPAGIYLLNLLTEEMYVAFKLMKK